MDPAPGRDDREPPVASAAAPPAEVLLPAGSQGRSNREIAGQNPILVLEPGIAGDPRMVVRLKQILGRDLGSDTVSELPKPFSLRLDHLFEEALELV